MTGKEQAQPAHREVAELLPWYANGSLDANEASLVELHIAACAECRLELASFEAITRGVVDSNDGLPPASANLYARTLERVERFEGVRQQTPGEALRRFLLTLREAWISVSAPARFAVAAQFVAIVLLLAGAVGFARQSAGNLRRVAAEKQRADQVAAELADQKKQYVILSEACSQSKGTGDAVELRVAFQENAPEKKIRELMEQVRGRIVDGPTAAGYYTLAVSAAPDAETAKREAIKQLTAQKDIVLFAKELR
jgi:hypothetical protein